MLALALPIGLAYSKVSTAYFCSYDDFREAHRAAFEDTRVPSRIFTTSHFDSYKYRPLNRLTTFVTYHIGGGRPQIFRIRNLIFHLVAVWLVYLVGLELFRARRTSALGALLFGLHPLANQSVTIAASTNTMAHAAFLATLVLFFASLRSRSSWWAWLGASLTSGWLALFLYDSSIVVFALIGAYLGLSWIVQGKRPGSRRFLAVLVISVLAVLASYALQRAAFVPQVWGKVKPDWPSSGDMARNLAMYVGAILLPLDPVLAHEWWETPLPSDIRLTGTAVVGAGCLALAAITGFTWILAKRARARAAGPGADERLATGFLVGAIAAPLVPVLLVTSHASETYVYLPVAFYAMALSFVLDQIALLAASRRHMLLFALVGALLLGLASAATWVRNERVFACGATARRILTGLPQDRLKDGDWTLLFADHPRRLPRRRYGHYTFRGLDTIDDGPGANSTMSAALQVTYGNSRLSGEIVEPAELVRRCSLPPSNHLLCWWVGEDGALKEFTPSVRDAFHLE